MKKKESEDTMDGILGSTAIAGATDTMIALKSNAAGQRTICSRQRYGTDMPETLLEWLPDSRELSLGVTADEAAKQTARQTSNRIEADIMEFVRATPTCDQPAVFAAIRGNTTLKKRAFQQLFDSAVLVIESGNGVKGSPFLYRLADAPIGL